MIFYFYIIPQCPHAPLLALLTGFEFPSLIYVICAVEYFNVLTFNVPHQSDIDINRIHGVSDSIYTYTNTQQFLSTSRLIYNALFIVTSDINRYGLS